MFKHFIHKHAFFFGIMALLGIIALVFFTHRAQLLSRYDNEYARDLYDHSQWTIAKSVRGISDEELYQVAGYDFLKTKKFFSINPEVPVLSKYVFGYTIAIFGNAQVIGFISYLLALSFLFSIAKNITSDKKALFIVLLAAMEPLLASHAGTSLLDLPQLVCLFIHIYAMIILLQKNKKIWLHMVMIVLAGVSLGAFISFKFGWLGLIILFADVYIGWRIKKIWQIILIAVIAGIFYIATYIEYFLQGNSIIDFLKVQKWVVMFYVNSKAPKNPLNEIAAIFLGFIKGWNVGAVWSRVSEWTLLWPLYGISTVILIKNLIKKKITLQPEIVYLLVLAILLFLSYLIIPFFARYLMLLLPVLTLIFIVTISKSMYKYMWTIGIVATLFFLISLSNSPYGFIGSISDMWGKGIYQDIYRHLDESSKNKMDRLTFWRDQQQLEKDLGIKPKSVTFAQTIVLPWQTTITIPVTIVFESEFGTFPYEKEVTFERKVNQWHLVWKDAYQIPTESNRYQMIQNSISHDYGTLLNSDTGDVLIHQGNWPYLYVTPQKIKDDVHVIAQLKLITGLDGYDIEAKYKANAQPDWAIPISFLRRDMAEGKFQLMNLDPGISWQPKQTYVYVHSEDKAYIGVYFDELFQTYRLSLEPIKGGVIGITDLSTGQKTIFINQEGKDGSIVKLTTAEIYRIGKK